MKTKQLTVKWVQAQLSALKVAFRSLPETGEFRVVVMGKPEIQAYYTDDFGDALDTGKAMVEPLALKVGAL